MKLVTASQFALARTRKQLKAAFKNNDWQAVRDVDQILVHSLNDAFDDTNRDTRALIEELEKIVGLYGEMVARLPVDSERMANPSSE